VEKRWRDTKAALGEERRMRRAAERQAAEAQGAFEAQMRALAERTGQGAPDVRADPAGTLEWVQQRILQADAWEAERREGVAAERRQAAETSDLTREFQEAEAEFREVAPDYDDAARYLREARLAELAQLGLDRSRALQVFRREVLSSAKDLEGTGISPARYAYVMALQQGYVGPGSVPPPSGGGLESIARGQAAAKSLGGFGGRGGGELTHEYVASLSGEAFDAAFKRLTAQERERERRR
jgi:hypothetical protein